jgi:hypothetical protein
VSRGLGPEISESSNDLLFVRVRIYIFHSDGDIIFQRLQIIVVVLCEGEEASTMTVGIWRAAGGLRLTSQRRSESVG